MATFQLNSSHHLHQPPVTEQLRHIGWMVLATFLVLFFALLLLGRGVRPAAAAALHQSATPTNAGIGAQPPPTTVDGVESMVIESSSLFTETVDETLPPEEFTSEEFTPEDAAPAETKASLGNGTEASAEHDTAATIEPLIEEVVEASTIDEVAVLPAPVLIGPENNSSQTGINAPPTGVPLLHWSEVVDATRYELQVSRSAGFPSTVVKQVTANNSFVPLNSLADGDHYWRVRAGTKTAWGEWSETWRFSKDWSNGGQLVPILLAPENGVQLAAFAPEQFSWTAVQGAATYKLEISTDPTFQNVANLVYSAVSIKTHHTPLSRVPNNPASPYYWRVIPLDAQGTQGWASAPGNFIFDWNIAPELIAPEDGLVTPFLPRFMWQPVTGARQYQLQLAADE
jgi:hypothetical protein